MAQALTWSLVIATYNRGNILRRCIDLAVKQSRPPREVVIVDASANWQEIRDQVMQEIGNQHPEIRWEYQEARVRSSTTQRNQAIDLATSDVLFLIDDDSLLYPGCAELVMRIYEADLEVKILGVAPMAAGAPPPDAGDNVPGAITPSGKPGVVRRLKYYLEQQVEVDKLLLPYDASYPDRPVPESVKPLDVAPVHYFHGFRMTYRRSAIARERFDEFLQRYAAAEDLDASYRVSRHGALVNAMRAQLFHAQDPSARLTRYTRNVLGIMNLAVLYRLKGHDPRAMFRTFRRRLWRRMFFDLLRDLARKRFKLPYSRATWFSLGKLNEVLGMSEEALKQWYPKFQVEMIEKNPD
jgi:glycosyltransferase involved in cell wall biosynthesis